MKKHLKLKSRTIIFEDNIAPPAGKNLDHYLRSKTDAGAWREFAQFLLTVSHLNRLNRAKFHDYWSVAGAEIRAQINDDRLLADMLRHILPSYIGPSVILYRGENRQRWEMKRIGFCWTPSRETAQMFGQGLNAVRGGGVLLRCDAASLGVIAGPSAHSHYLRENEYTLDPSHLRDVAKIGEFPSVK